MGARKLFWRRSKTERGNYTENPSQQLHRWGLASVATVVTFDRIIILHWKICISLEKFPLHFVEITKQAATYWFRSLDLSQSGFIMSAQPNRQSAVYECAHRLDEIRPDYLHLSKKKCLHNKNENQCNPVKPRTARGMNAHCSFWL